LFGLVISTPYLHHTQSTVRRRMTIALVVIVTAANFAAEGVLIHYLLRSGGTGGRSLVFSAAQIWFTNVAAFGLWFWEVDRGGPQTHLCTPGVRRSWTISTVAFTNASAFSPTDAMPLSVRIKTLMLIQSIASFLTVGVVAARAVNILNM